MTAIDNTPSNRNYLNLSHFKVHIKKAPNVNFFVQKVNLADISLKEATVSNPFVNVPIPGDHVTFGNFEFSFLIDEDMQDFLEIFNWIIALGKPENFDQYAQIASKPAYTGEGIVSDISVTLLNSSFLPNYEILYIDAFPVSLSTVVLDSTDNTTKYAVATAKFKYTNYTVNKSN
jgi:hypothetical protein